MAVDHALKLLEAEFKTMIELFKKDDWKFFKFGQGGPYKRTLTHLQKKAQDNDSVIFGHFGKHEDTASFGKLIVLCLSAAKTPKERYEEIDTFRRQIKRMWIII